MPAVSRHRFMGPENRRSAAGYLLSATDFSSAPIPYIREQLRQGTAPEAMIEHFCKEHPDCILICDEIGNGIVPMEAEERTYRERTGRILEQLAAQADEVVRVVCGIGPILLSDASLSVPSRISTSCLSSQCT